MRKDKKCIHLAHLANVLQNWIECDKLKAECHAWYLFRMGISDVAPAPVTIGPTIKDSAYSVFSAALAAVRAGWSSKAGLHTERVERAKKLKETLTVPNVKPQRYFGLAPRDGKI